MIEAGQNLINIGAKNILIKGGHLNSKKLFDILINKSQVKIFKNKKYITKNTHGTGCTLSSAIATNLSCGKSLINSFFRFSQNFLKVGVTDNQASKFQILEYLIIRLLNKYFQFFQSRFII